MKFNQEHVVGAICLVVAGIILSITPSFPHGKTTVGLTGPAFFPNLMAFIFIGCGIYQLWHGTTRAKDYKIIQFSLIKSLFANKESRTTYLVLGLIVLFILLFNFLGFLITTFLFLGSFMLRLGVPKLRTAVYSIVFTAVIFLLFGWLFTISLPSGILEYIGL